MSTNTVNFKNANEQTLSRINKIFKIFTASTGIVRPHFILTGPSGSGKSFNLAKLAEELDCNYMEINAAQLTKEGTSGNSLSKALSPLRNVQGALTICLVDEFDKLFISGNNNSQLAHEVTNGVQNEFLKVLEGKTTSVYDDFGKYVDAPASNVLFVFAGAFNGEENITIDRLRDFGIKTEFLGRVSQVYSLTKLTLEELKYILDNSELLRHYLALVNNPPAREKVISDIMSVVTENYELNTLGARYLDSLIHRYFIEGGLTKEEVKKISFQKKLEF